MKSKHEYTHQDEAGLLWRFEGSRPISQLMDRVIADIEAADEIGGFSAKGIKEVLQKPRKKAE